MRKVAEGFVSAAKRKALAASAKVIRDAPLFVVDSSGAPLPCPIKLIEDQLRLWHLAQAGHGLVILHGIERFLDDAPEGETLETLLKKLRALTEGYGVTLVVTVPVFPKNPVELDRKPTRARWLRSLPSGVMDTSDMVMLITAQDFQRRPDPDDLDPIWQINVLKRRGPSTEIQVFSKREWSLGV